jgi:tetratricopeptide (TPR) repeat protein
MEVIMSRRPSRIAAAFILLLMTATGAAAQASHQVYSPQDILSDANITVTVFGPDHTPLRQQAFVTLYSFGSNIPLGTVTTTVSSEAVLSNMPGWGPYTVSVSSPGYETERKDFEWNSASGRVSVDVTLHPVSGVDAASIPAATLPPNAQKHVQKGLEAMKAGKLPEAQKEFIAAYNATPKNAYVCYLLGDAYLKSKDFPHAQTYLGMATSIDPQNVQALVAFGQLHHQQKDYHAAIAPLEKAASLDPKEWLARWILADIYLRGGEYEKARQDAEEAVELGRGGANKAELIEGQALAELGRRDDAIRVLEAFLHDVPGDPAAPAVQALIAKLQSGTPERPRNPATSQ